MDYYFIFGPEPNQVIAQYREFTGAAPMLPRWAYGFWQCRERYSSQQQILDTAAEFRTRKIPVDALVQDWQYWGKYGWNAMKFDESAYPDPAKMMDELHRQDLHMVISVWAKFGSETAGGSRFCKCAFGSDEQCEHRRTRRSEGTGELGRFIQSERAKALLV